MFKWPVVPLCEKQLRDVNPKDILCDGLYRKCNTYKGGGGYDKFTSIYSKRFGLQTDLFDQFVVQVKGCPLKCTYCYVTDEGINGNAKLVDTDTIMCDFYPTHCRVFHLMGGAPALYVEHWPEILNALNQQYVFHSDLLLVEKEYTKEVIDEIARFPNSLHAVSIKGADKEEFYKNTQTELNEELFWNNLYILVESKLQYYFTFTGMSPESIERFKDTVNSRFNKPEIFEDSFAIELVHYKALD